MTNVIMKHSKNIVPLNQYMLLVYFNWLYSGWQKRLYIWDFHIRDFYFKDNVILEDSKGIVAEYYFQYEKSLTKKYLHRISLRK
jgi:hypothetical protein